MDKIIQKKIKNCKSVFSINDGLYLREFNLKSNKQKFILTMKKFILKNSICNLNNYDLKFFVSKNKIIFKNKKELQMNIIFLLNQNEVNCNLCLLKFNECYCNNKKQKITCCICLETITFYLNKVSICNNEHYIHKNCYLLLKNKNCPLCRNFHQCINCIIPKENLKKSEIVKKIYSIFCIFILILPIFSIFFII